jgi:hypothetical protein
VTLDVSVCNFTRDNSGRARQVFHPVISTLKPVDSVCHDVVRGKIGVEA